MIGKIVALTLISIIGSQSVLAQQGAFDKLSGQLDGKALYVGGGITSNSLDLGYGDASAMGFQFYSGLELGKFAPVNAKLAIEVGYATTGDFEVDAFGTTISIGSADGLWGSGVASYQLNDQVSLLGRAGIDIGDDSGMMFGFGAGYRLSPQAQVNGEYVIRDDTSGLQLNVNYHF